AIAADRDVGVTGAGAGGVEVLARSPRVTTVVRDPEGWWSARVGAGGVYQRYSANADHDPGLGIRAGAPRRQRERGYAPMHGGFRRLCRLRRQAAGKGDADEQDGAQ